MKNVVIGIEVVSDALPALAAFDPGPGAEPPLCSLETTNFSGSCITLSRSQRSRFNRQAQRKRECGHKCYPVEHLCGRVSWIKFRCRVRTCANCGDAYKQEKQSRYKPLTRYQANSRDRAVRFLTLTFPNVTWEYADDCTAWIRERTEKLRLFLRPSLCRACRWREKPCECAVTQARDRAPRKCRRCRNVLEGCADRKACARVAWRVRGYLATWEVTEGRDGKFHPHLHLVVSSGFIPVFQLRNHWQEWFGAWHCDVRKIQNGPRAIGYILKYLGKPWAGISDEVQQAGFYRTRRLTSAGEFYGAEMDALVTSGETRAQGSERRHVRLCCEHCGVPQPDAVAIVANDRCARARGSPCQTIHGVVDPDGFKPCGHWRRPESWAPRGKAWIKRGEWCNAGRSKHAHELPAMAEAAKTIGLDWSGAVLWDDVQQVKLPSAADA